jgi:sialate O-acetylesterase
VQGFAIAGEDRTFVWAQAEIVGHNQIKVSSPDVPYPVAVRYGWADNPVLNLRDLNGLPVTPFRTDDWPGVTAGKVK